MRCKDLELNEGVEDDGDYQLSDFSFCSPAFSRVGLQYGLGANDPEGGNFPGSARPQPPAGRVLRAQWSLLRTES